MNFTSDECRKTAKAKLARAKHEPRRNRNLRNAAEAWMLLAQRIDEMNGVAKDISTKR
jgi:hypothetical protein